MKVDLENLSPAPWVAWQIPPTASNDWAGKCAIAGLPMLTVDRSPVFKEADAFFIAMARGAFAGDTECLIWWEANRTKG